MRGWVGHSEGVGRPSVTTHLADLVEAKVNVLQ